MTTEAEAEALRERLNEAGQRDPREFPVGAFVGDTYPIATVFVFVWFGSSTDLLDTLAECEPVLHLDPGTEEYKDILARLTAVRESQRPHDELTETLRGEFDAVLSDMEAGLRWWGTFDDLVAGEGEFERELRAAFRDDPEDDELAGRAISPDEADEFVGFVAEYGI